MVPFTDRFSGAVDRAVFPRECIGLEIDAFAKDSCAALEILRDGARNQNANVCRPCGS